MFLECKHEAGCIGSGHLLPEESRPNFIVLILEDLSPDLSSFRHKKSWDNFSHIKITNFHIFIIIFFCFLLHLLFFFSLEVQLLHIWAMSVAQSWKNRFLALPVWHNSKQCHQIKAAIICSSSDRYLHITSMWLMC